ncbi:roadblock/LC7 domain-containing protein [Methanoplanus sp. FWC-SCC4]|uniref:Roadblock/LC7 domain-containing protein n=1 Tax=Methanochimaera problematica TaxID=2609417 RepID=A0AA97FAE3_9EURY|nr:roadblock/LC7 domain-containing protein [Methanoplanus sp. FWC-SCC4]WOF15815.1 roadblock/LC7 domain-containing protein [Methanoplanus sp. FWC-SCC4]
MNESGPLKTKINDFISEIMAIEGVLACSIVSTEGQIIGKSDSSKAPSPFLGITGATLYASAEAACSTFHISTPEYILVETVKKDGYIMIKAAGKRNLIATVITDTVNTSEVKNLISQLSEKIGEEI